MNTIKTNWTQMATPMPPAASNAFGKFNSPAPNGDIRTHIGICFSLEEIQIAWTYQGQH